MYLLDSNTCVHLLRGTNRTVQERFVAHSQRDIVLCSVVKAELEYGARRSKRVGYQLGVLQNFFGPLRSLAFDDRCAEEYGQICAALAAEGSIMGANDLLIAAIARANDATLVTHNSKEFQRVPGLRLVDWEQP